MNKEILYKIEVIYDDLVKNYVDKVRFISNDKNMSNGTVYVNYDFKNFRYIQTYVSDNFNIFDKYKEQEDKITNLQNENEGLKDGNKKMLKSLQELQNENNDLKEELSKADSITQSCIFNGKKESKISYRKCLNMLKQLENENQKLKEQNEFLKLNNPEMNSEHFRIIKENKRKIDNLRNENTHLKETNEEHRKINGQLREDLIVMNNKNMELVRLLMIWKSI